MIRVFGIPEHGKREVDHVGGTAKTNIKRGVSSGMFFNDVAAMVKFLDEKFGNNNNPNYVIKEKLQGRIQKKN